MKIYRVRYKRYDGYYSFIEVSGEDMNELKAKNQAIDYLEANGRPYEKIDDVYEVNNEAK